MSYLIAVVDDDSTNLIMVKQILGEVDCRVVPLKSGMALFKYLKEHTPELVLLDYLMPDMDGLETLSKLRAYEQENGLPRIPDAIINKPGKLTDEEYEVIKEHPQKGAKILENILDMPDLSVGATWHHERYDGKGYPDHLVGEEIPKAARIIAVADAYDAMSSRRSYRGVIPQEKIRAEIEKGKGTQFDPVFADIMLQMIDDDKDYNMREKTDE